MAKDATEPIEVDERRHVAGPERWRGVEIGTSFYRDAILATPSSDVAHRIAAAYAVYRTTNTEAMAEWLALSHTIAGTPVFRNHGGYAQVSRAWRQVHPYYRFDRLAISPSTPFIGDADPPGQCDRAALRPGDVDRIEGAVRAEQRGGGSRHRRGPHSAGVRILGTTSGRSFAAMAAWSVAAVCLIAFAAVASGQVAASEGLAIVVHRANPIDALTRQELRRIFMLDTQTWPHGRKITVVLREKGQPERAEAIRLICGLSEPEFERHVLYQTFRGSVDRAPRSIQSASAMLRFIFNTPGAIGYVRADEVDDTVKVLQIDRLPGDARNIRCGVPCAPAERACRRGDHGLGRPRLNVHAIACSPPYGHGPHARWDCRDRPATIRG